MKAKTKSPHIGIDLMGSESDPKSLLLSILETFGLKEDIRLTLIGSDELKKEFDKKTYSYIHFETAKSTIEMDEDPLYALRRKKDSSVSIGITNLKNNIFDAFISAGSTGAIVSHAALMLDKLESISRPALISVLPTKKGPLAVLDVGANLTCKSKNLIQYAKLGAAYQNAKGIENPNVALLNIGAEEKKGTSEVKTAYKHLSSEKNKYFTFFGNIEGKEVFNGDIDVLITDAFTGNVFLKTSEGITSLILDELSKSIPEMKTSLDPFVQDLKKKLYYTEYPGALLIGVDAIVIKCHSYAPLHSIHRAIQEAQKMIRNNFLTHVKRFF